MNGRSASRNEVAAGSSPPALSRDAGTFAWRTVSLPTDVQPIRDRRHQQARLVAGKLDDDPANLPMSSLGWKWLRSGVEQSMQLLESGGDTLLERGIFGGETIGMTRQVDEKLHHVLPVAHVD